MTGPETEIIDFDRSLASRFYELNAEWVERYFSLEAADLEVLGDPETHIIARGGVIVFARSGVRIVGTCAVMPTKGQPGHFELAKMAVTAECQGRGIGRALLLASIARFKSLGGRVLFLETNEQLLPAIHLYESVGFKRAARPEHTAVYARANVYMVYSPTLCVTYPRERHSNA